MKYVVGFIFSPCFTNGVLIWKQRPAWQHGRLNGVGGKVEEGETFEQAMERECWEETGIEILADEWQRVVHLKSSKPDEIGFFFVTTEKWNTCRSITDERVIMIQTDRLHRYTTIPNLQWLIPLCVNHRNNLNGYQMVLPIRVDEFVREEVRT